jgi:hypothetical protein
MMTAMGAKQPSALVFYAWFTPEVEILIETLPHGLVNGGFSP